MSFGFGSSTPASGGFGGFGGGATTGGFGSSAAASPFGGGAPTGGFGSSTSTFGAGAPKSSFGGFGAAAPATGGGFGAQQTTTTGFGGFGAAPQPATGFGVAANPATTSGFGAASAFGGGAATGGFGSSGTSAFGASTPFGAKTATSSSPFGSTSTFGAGAGTTSAFGGGPTGGFGTPTPAASGGMFGGSAGGFGASAAKSPFGATSTATTSGFGAPSAGTSGFGGFGAQPAAAPPAGQVQVGTGAPPYQPTREMEPSGTGGTANYMSISRMPAYAHKSTEELRYEDYLKRTNPAAAQAAAALNAPAPGATTGGAGAFGGFGAQPATSSAFGSAGGFGSAPSAFGATASAAGGFGSSAFGATAAPSTAGGFGGFGAQPAAPATSGGLFGNTAARPATGGFGAPATSSAFGAAPGATSAFGAPATGGGFGASTGGFGSSFGAQAPAAQQQTSGFGSFGAATPAASSGFGASAFGKPAVSAGFGGFGATATPTPASTAGGFGFGTVQPQAGATTSLFGGASATAPASTGFSFGATAPKPAAAGGFGFGSTGGSSAFGSTTGSAFGVAGAESKGDGGAQENEFKFTSSLFRNSMAKKLVIDKGEQTVARNSGASSHASVVPLTDSDRTDSYEIGSARSRLLKSGDDGKYGVTFCNLTNKKAFSIRLHPNQTVKEARLEVKQLLRDSSASAASSIVDIELILKGRIVHDASTIEDLQLKEGDSIDVVVIEDRAEDNKKREQSPSTSSLTKKPEPQTTDKTAPPKRFMTYDEYLASASRDEGDLFKDTETSSHSRALAGAPSCPVLKNEDYFTIPSYERLQAMTDHELSQVEKFTVGCRGLGAVEWIGKTDVRDLDIDELVLFEKKEVIVYKDDDKKHELGMGLNKPAIVELLGIFPPRKSTSPDKYKDRVKQRTQDIGATFLDYSPDKGIWRFRVEHFSRYGFDDDDDDDSDIDMDGHNDAPDSGDKALHMHQLTQKSGMIRGHVPNRGKMLFPADRSGLFRQSAMYSGDISSNHVVASFGDHQSPSVKESWSGMSVDSNSIGPESESLISSSTDEKAVVKKDQRPTSEVFPVIPYTLKPLGASSNAEPLSPSEKSTTYQMMLAASSQSQNGIMRNHVDGGMFMARSFRCSWGPNGELINLGKLVSRSEAYSEVENKGRRVCIEVPLRPSETRKSDLHEGLKLHYECTASERNARDEYIDQDDSVCEVPPPFALPAHQPLMNCLHKYVAHAEKQANGSSTSSFQTRTLLLWKLIQALWGQEHGAKIGDPSDSSFYPLASRDDPDEVETLDTLLTVDLRREAISQWFETALKDTESFGNSPSPEGVLRLLCQHRIAEASEMAMECGDFRLATLIAQAASYEGSDFRNLLETQMAQWSENGTLDFMDKTLVLVYSVLAGSVEVLSAQKGASMSWISCLALFLWYKRGPSTPLKSAMLLYEDAVDKQLAASSLSQFAAADTDKYDVLMELMKLYIEDAASLCKVLSPSGFMTQGAHHLDYELSWHLHSVLRAIGYKLDRQWESHIHQNFIRQLESSGLWEDAVYVALNISDANERESSCRELLFRNADILASDVSKREELCMRLNIPTEWVSEALAVRAVSKQEHHDEIAHWIAARHYEEAHACLISHVAFPCMFGEEKDILMQLLLELDPMASYIPQWKSCEKVDSIGGGLLLEYLRLEQAKGLESGHEDQFLQRVLLLSQQLSSARDASANGAEKKCPKETVVAQTCVLSMIVSLATQAVQLQSLLSYTQERELTSDMSLTPLELDAEFLGGLSHLVTGRESSFVESYRTSHLMHLCSTFIDWRA
ncbi:hypothetical protein BBO99_00002254 [Phytophthora kernoviae]|uniref:Peptidase S59 domain-containing protein n=2 Tax=Phytophthora kernoviae TaxID=325452 RepID=A0A3R7KMK8_9STRA|nr:hypothetical protein G195_003715 [Phytophthora kernoviae 00238/432]KAG2529699.1 hypothetical protein JM16_001869 [Phytophthora kernoviae]KAG2531010.1 hypothetical protein JM18_001917 [Phytophthora kernoviae]RLN37076.1 hypothetical protein BBI17_003309 [Phytophthora kernoviae]RLN83322.1 hypothetical protein BBO99_00002254 [Phytophthora kernoviae]